MKNYIKKLLKNIMFQIIFFMIFFWTVVFAAISWPASKPSLETSWWIFTEYFNNIKWSCPSWQVIKWFNSDFTKNCVSNAAATKLTTCWWILVSNSTPTNWTTYTQTWDWDSWEPTINWWETQTECDFNCNINYTWNGTSCVAVIAHSNYKENKILAWQK
jgi:hypothetical protein